MNDFVSNIIDNYNYKFKALNIRDIVMHNDLVLSCYNKMLNNECTDKEFLDSVYQVLVISKELDSFIISERKMNTLIVSVLSVVLLILGVLLL